MYDTIVLESVAETLVEQQDNPMSLLEDLNAVVSEHEDTPREFRRFQLVLELDADDLDTVMGRVEQLTDTDER
ncbi:hypothetical protein HRTV-11_gp56 [Halorubrum virus HRTV-11]|uniref:Uncharacterized protein n=1 Tax=Halorubrum sodomense tailed virus 2 TaxID=1262527 RepID=L7TGM1_9CAUD|nr:hypothetical protein HSTV2_55 [Halorubrum sodomense tailed virus 2]AGC34324.1 hypothetical protein HSTV2_55 [Halorubrum sodomense tailed virus 2]UBF22205.1 hypothetical protein HRTV-2_gp57 [Halorubrum virus HRTV-2]UBF22313.1 hypothetical protein HRTV-11_gp56 [Halorubrum virus HRTV-11]